MINSKMRKSDKQMKTSEVSETSQHLDVWWLKVDDEVSSQSKHHQTPQNIHQHWETYPPQPKA